MQNTRLDDNNGYTYQSLNEMMHYVLHYVEKLVPKSCPGEEIQENLQTEETTVNVKF